MSLQNSYGEALILSVMVFGDGLFGRQFGHEGRDLMGLVPL